MATEVGKGYVSITTDTKGLQGGLAGMGAELGGKLGPIGAAAGQLLGNKMGQGLTESSGGAKGAIGSLAGLLSKAGPWGIAAGAAVAATAGVGIALYKMGSDFETNYRTIARDTGATGQQLSALQQSFRDVAKSGPSSFGAVTTAITEVQRYTGPMGAQLDGISKQFLTLSRITGTDVKTNVDAGTHALENWNISQKNAPKALNELFTASQKSGIGFSSLAEDVTKFGPPMRAMGYSFQGSTAMMAAFGKTGANSSRVFSAMQIGAAKLAKAGSKDIPEAMAQTINSIKGAANQTDAMNIATKEFGTRGAVQMVDAIRSGKFNFDEMTKSVESSGNSIQDTAKRTQTLGGAFGTFKNAAAVAFAPLASDVFKGINRGLTDILTALTPLVTWLGDNLPGAITHTTNAFKDAFNFIEKWAYRISNAIAAIYEAITPLRQMVGAVFTTMARLALDAWHILEPIFKGMIDAFKVVWDVLHGNWAAAGRAIWDLVKDIGRALEGIPKLIFDFITAPFADLGPGVAHALGNFWNEVASIPNKIGGFLENVAPQVWNAISSGFGVAIGAVEDGLKDFWGWITGLAQRVWNGLQNMGGFVWNAIVSAWHVVIGAGEEGLKDFWGWVVGLAQRVWGGLQNIGGEIWNAASTGFAKLKDGAVEGATALWTWLSGLPGQIGSALAGAGGWLLQAGKSLVQGFVNGIGALPHIIEDALLALVPGPLKKFASALGLGSPSKIFHQFGVDTIQGFVNGIKSMQPTVTAALTSVAPTSATTGLGLDALGGGGTSSNSSPISTGPAVVIQNVNLHDNLDVEAFMKKAAWVVKTQGV